MLSRSSGSSTVASRSMICSSVAIVVSLLNLSLCTDGYVAATSRERLAEHLPRQQGAFDADVEFGDALEGFEVAKLGVGSGAVDEHRLEVGFEPRGVGGAPLFDCLGHQRGGGLADRAATSPECDRVDAIAVQEELQVDLVTTERVDPFRRGIRPRQFTPITRPAVVVEDDFLVQVIKLWLRCIHRQPPVAATGAPKKSRV